MENKIITAYSFVEEGTGLLLMKTTNNKVLHDFVHYKDDNTDKQFSKGRNISVKLDTGHLKKYTISNIVISYYEIKISGSPSIFTGRRSMYNSKITIYLSPLDGKRLGA